ncbi:MAG: hypothetical protein AB1422_07920 [bacterium]
MKRKFFILSLICGLSLIIGCAKKEEKKVVVLPPQIPIAKPEMYIPEKYEYKSALTRDPFVPLIVSEVKPVAGDKGLKLSEINILNLELSGIIWDKKEIMALFHDGNHFGYILKKGNLYADNYRPIAGIWGKFIKNREVFLQQGKTEVNFFIGKPKITKIKGAAIGAQQEMEEIPSEETKL